MRINYDGLILGDGQNATTDSYGATWLSTAITGWESMPSRLSSLDYTMRHGGVTANPTYGPKPLGLSGVCKVPNEEVFWFSYNLLLGMAADLKTSRPLTITEGTVEKTIDVVRGAEPRFKIMPAHFTWDISFTAFDPLKYGEPVTASIAAGATATIVNDGNIESPRVLLTATGAGRVMARHEESQVLLASRPAVSSGTVIDLRARTVYLGAENRHFQLSPSSSWWMLDPGSNSITNEGDAPLSITYRPAWA